MSKHHKLIISTRYMIRRLNRELSAAPKEGDVHFVDIIDDRKDRQLWRVTCGAGDTIAFDRAEIDVSVDIPPEYPFKAPSVLLNKHIFHPNVLKGQICLATLKEWTPKSTVEDIVREIRKLLMTPCADSVLCPEALEIYQSNKQEYIMRAVESLTKLLIP